MSGPRWRALSQWLRWPALRTETAQIAGWVLLAVVSVVVAHKAPVHDIAPPVARLRDLVVLGQLVAAGVSAFGAVLLWRRFGSKRRLAGYAAIWGLTVLLVAPALAEDFSLLAGKLRIPHRVAQALLVAGTAAAVPVAAFLGSLVARPWLRLLGVIGAVAVAAANPFIFGDDYQGLHLVAGMAAATLGGAALATEDAPARPWGRYVVAALGLFGLASVVRRPSNSVTLALGWVPGDIVAQLVTRLRASRASEVDVADLGATVDPAALEWWKSRLGHAPIPPSEPAVLPKNAVVILMAVDALRADVFSNDRNEARLPALFAFRDASVDFTLARSAAPSTTQAVSAIFMGRYYSEGYWHNRPNWNPEAMYPHFDDTPRFTQILQRAGVRTVTISGMSGITNEFGVRGFQEEDILPGLGNVTAGQIMKRLIARLDRQGPGPLFVYIHFGDAHAPYAHGKGTGSPWNRYLQGVELVDHEIATLVAKVEATPELKDRTALFLTADHGEAFGEHGTNYHAVSVYDELLRVPLFARLPGVAPRKIATPVTLVDLAPTVLDLYGLPTPGEVMGQSLVPFFRGEDPALARPIVADSGRMQRAIIFPDGYKVIHDRRQGTVQLFDLKVDPLELHDLFDDSGALGAARLGALEAFFKAHTLNRPGYVVPYCR